MKTPKLAEDYVHLAQPAAETHRAISQVKTLDAPPERVPATIYCPTCKNPTMRLATVLPLLTADDEWEATYLCSTCRDMEKRSAKV